MNINILRSSFQTDEFVWNEYAELIERLKTECQASIQINGNQLSDVVMIATGGVENMFKTLFTGNGPVTLIADGRNNSLAAALEILTWLEGQGIEGRILHGTNDEIIATFVETQHTTFLQGVRIGLFGQPSDWLIASGVDRNYLLEHFGVETIDIDLQRLMDGIKSVSNNDAAKVAQAIVKRAQNVKEPSCADMLEAAKTYLVLKRICQEERLDAITIRCFDIVNACGTTSCLALALLNDEGIVAGCEGDMQTLMSMLLVKRLCSAEAFMANPSQLTDQTAMLAHCTIPLKMCDDLILRSHFESGIGVAIQGVLPITDYTLFKWGGPRLNRFFVAEAQAVGMPYSDHFCRTQITLNADLRPYLLQHSIGNHHVIIKGRHAEEIREAMGKLGVRREK
jgi:L-fucose isomerase-like protein